MKGLKELKRKITALLIAVSVIGSNAYAALFSDSRNHWAAEYINTLSDKGIINGVSEDKFAPNGTVTRAEYLKIIMNVTGIATTDFRSGECLELNGSEWYAPYLQSALDKGLIPKEMIASYSVEIINDEITGTRAVYSGAFNGSLPITRQEMAVLTQHMYQYQQNARTMQNTVEPAKLDFEDIGSISDWALPSVELAVAQGFIFGMDNGNFEPNSTATRAQAAAIAFRVLGK